MTSSDQFGADYSKVMLIKAISLTEDRLIHDHRICVPSLTSDVINEYHRYNHCCYMKCFLLLKSSFVFNMTDKELAKLCENIIRRCSVCQCVRKASGTRPGTLDYFPIPNDIFSHLCMDFLQLDPCQDAEGEPFDYVFVIVCRLSGFILGIACRKQGMTAEKAARLFLNHVVVNFGLPHEIMSDNDHLINSKFFNTLCSISGVTHHTSILYRPRGKGRAESEARLIVDMLRKSLTNVPGHG